MNLWKLALNGKSNEDVYLSKEDAVKMVEKIFARRMERAGYDAMRDREAFKTLCACSDPDSSEYCNETTVVIDSCFVSVIPICL